MTQRVTVLVSSAGRRVALLRLWEATLVRRGLAGRVIAADTSNTAPAAHAAGAQFRVPPVASDEFIPAVLDLCRAEAVTLVVPTIDPELGPYAEHRDEFAAVGTTVGVSALAVTAIASDKVATHVWLTERGFPTVRQTTVIDALAAPGEWPFPLVVKPRFGSASIGVRVVHDRTDLERAGTDDQLVVQTIAPGVEHTVDLFVDRDGRCRVAVPRRRLEVRSGEVSKGMTVHDAAIETLAAQVAEALPGAFGVLNLQLFSDGHALHVIEVNPRFGGGYPLSAEAGADLTGLLLEDVLDLPPRASTQWRAGRVMLRYDDAVFVDAEAAGLEA
jgi:carbamoyl-phosphate synthase large subunit